jgi:AmiR/NasT family two-component response regulator
MPASRLARPRGPRELPAARWSPDVRELIDLAKEVLMLGDRYSEAEAFRRIQKTSMDTRTSMADVARAVLLADLVRRPGSPS